MCITAHVGGAVCGLGSLSFQYNEVHDQVPGKRIMILTIFFRENAFFTFAKKVSPKPLVPSVRCLLAPVHRLALRDRQIHTQDKYCNPRSACTPRVN